MRNIIVGTAGHIDHGKTSLVKALTGTDADRLAEEKRRGITIDLGFAHLEAADDLRLGFVDVPGHERFVRNMLAGAAGIDVVLFVVAADESIKPQTREHFDICRLLGVRAGVVAITRADLVDRDIVELVRLEVDEFVAGSFLEGAPKVAVSSVTGAGIPELLRELEAVARAVAVKNDRGIFRLPVDRAFTMKGFGSVVTGTTVSGCVKREAEVELCPTARVLRVRGLQVYGEQAEVALAGQRTAVNLPGIEPGEIERGMVLTEPGCLRAVTNFDARLELLRSAKPLKSGAPVHLHAGSASVEAEVRLLDKVAVLEPGGSAWARIVLKQPMLILPDDRFIIRMFSPVITIGGGQVVDISGFRYRAGVSAAERLAALAGGSLRERVERLVGEQEYGVHRGELRAVTGQRDVPASPGLEVASDWFISAERAREHRARMGKAVSEFHKANSLLPGVPRQDLRGRVTPGASQEIFELLLGGAGELVAEGEVVRLRSHKVALKQDESVARESILGAFESAGLTAPAVPEVLKAAGLDPVRARGVLQLLLREGVLVKISDDLTLHASALAGLRASLTPRRGQRFSVADFKDWTGVSRKYAIPLLEYLDRERVTRRDGDSRIII
jgi:selenocysteine-specific elongation factor